MSISSTGARVRFGAGLVVSGLLLPLSFTAQASSAIEEIVVTAQRTEQSLQEVPIAVTAFSGGMIEDRQIISPSDLQLNAPNVSYTDTNFGGSSFSIRGIGNLVIAASGESGVSFHQNEIAVPSNLPAAEFYDLERIEILRGPQGTLFGRNATGGAINMVTKMPDFESWNGFVDGEFGDYSHQRFKGALNIPIADNFAVRVAGMYLKRDGYIDNTAHGQVGDCVVPGSTFENPVTEPCTIDGIKSDLDGRDLHSYRITGLWEINENATWWLQYSRFKEDDDRVRITNQVCQRSELPVEGCDPNGFGFDTPHAGATTGGIFGGLNRATIFGVPTPPRAFDPPSTGFRKMHTDFQPVYDYEEDLWTTGFSYDFDRYTVSLQAAYFESEYLARQDYLMDVGFNLYATALNPSGLWPTSEPAGGAGGDWTSSTCNFADGTSGIFGGCILDVDQTRVFAYDQSSSEAEYWTVEAKLQSAFDGPFNFIVGANYIDSESFGDYYVVANTLDLVGIYGAPPLFPPLYPTMFNSTSSPDGGSMFEGYSVFGEVYYDFSPTVRFTAGLRYNHDEKEVADTGVLYNSFDLGAIPLIPGLPPLFPSQTWLRASLAPLLNPALIGTPDAAEATALAQYYGAFDPYLAALGGGDYLGAIAALINGVPPVPGFGEARDLTGSPRKAKWEEVTGRIGLDVQLSDSSMLYAFYTRGYKPGGFNPPLNESFRESGISAYTFDSEKVDSIEVGVKNVLLDGSLVLNGAFFMYDYKGLQVTRIANNTSLNDNIGADIMGAELEMFYRPAAVPGLSIDLAYSWLNARVSGSDSLDPLNRTAGDPNFITLKNIDAGSLTAVNYIARVDQLTPGLIQAAYDGCFALSDLNANPACAPVAPGTLYPNGIPSYVSRGFLEANGVDTSDGLETSLDGNRLPNSPEHTVHLGLAYTWNIDQIAGSLTARWDYYWQSKSYAREFNTRGDFIEDWDQHNASLIYESANGLWSAKAWVRNIADEDNVTGKYLTSDTSGFFRNYFLTEPRIYGLSVRYSFDNAR
jgi:iron complex outermembrane recepter protein